jgi:hypothetical protein
MARGWLREANAVRGPSNTAQAQHLRDKPNLRDIEVAYMHGVHIVNARGQIASLLVRRTISVSKG